MASLLRAAAKQGTTRNYVRRLLAAVSETGPDSPVRQALIDPLSERELEVLRLLGTELDGPAIARELMVSLNTVRTHTKNIYAKLAVTSRRAAVRRAAELELLPRPAATAHPRCSRAAAIIIPIITCGDAVSPHRLLAFDETRERPKRPPGKQKQRSAMSEISTGHYQRPGRYEIRLKGHLDARWAAWFDGLTLTHDSDGTTIIHGPVADQAALHGLLQKARDLGLPLISVNHVEPDHPRPTTETR